MNEYNLCGVLVHAQSGKIDLVRQQLEKQPGVEVHAVSDEGKLVVTVEDESRRQVADRIMKFHELEGVLSASMIYQFSDDEESIEKETSELNPNEERMSA